MPYRDPDRQRAAQRESARRRRASARRGLVLTITLSRGGQPLRRAFFYSDNADPAEPLPRLANVLEKLARRGVTWHGEPEANPSGEPEANP